MKRDILEQLAQLVLPKEILKYFEIVKIETEESYIDAMSIEERKNFVETFFAVFSQSGINNIMQLKDFKISTLLQLVKNLTSVPAATKRNLIAVLRMLITGMN